MPREEDLRRVVRRSYADLAGATKRGVGCCPPRSSPRVGFEACCRAPYSAAELSKIPPSARAITAGCGNPVVLTEIGRGQTVLDLGSGGGVDAFLAASKTGRQGKVIGVDSTPEMIWRAREAAQEAHRSNVEFRLGEIERLPLESSSVDTVISNCVINLSPDKDAVFREAFRVLKLGGRLAISDIVISGSLPKAVKNDAKAWASCVSGAIGEQEYLNKISGAGFSNIQVKQRVAVSWKAIGLAHSQGKKRQRPIPSFEIISEEIVATKPGKRPA